jgi:hypothetical protein
LRALGCGLGQGFYFAKPLPAAAAEALVTHQPGVAPRPSTLQVVESHHDTPVAICR